MANSTDNGSIMQKLDKISGLDNIDGGELMKFVRAFQSDHLYRLQTECKFTWNSELLSLWKAPFCLQAKSEGQTMQAK